MFRIRKPDAAPLEQIDLIGCRERLTLFQTEGRIPYDTASEAALAAAKSYLEHPETPPEPGTVDMVPACIWPDKMMPRPDPYLAELTD